MITATLVSVDFFAHFFANITSEIMFVPHAAHRTDLFPTLTVNQGVPFNFMHIDQRALPDTVQSYTHTNEFTDYF